MARARFPKGWIVLEATYQIVHLLILKVVATFVHQTLDATRLHGLSLMQLDSQIPFVI